MHDLKRISDIVRNPQRELGRKARHISSTAKVAISRYEEFVLRYDLSIVYAGHPLSQCNNGAHRAGSARYKRRRILPCSLACRVVARRVYIGKAKWSAFAKATARQSTLTSTTRAKTGGKGIRTPDFQLAKLALYQLSYAPGNTERFGVLATDVGVFECRLPIFDCKGIKAKCRMVMLFAIRHSCAFERQGYALAAERKRRRLRFVSDLREESPNTPLTRPYLDRRLYR